MMPAEISLDEVEHLIQGDIKRIETFDARELDRLSALREIRSFTINCEARVTNWKQLFNVIDFAESFSEGELRALAEDFGRLAVYVLGIDYRWLRVVDGKRPRPPESENVLVS